MALLQPRCESASSTLQGLDELGFHTTCPNEDLRLEDVALGSSCHGMSLRRIMHDSRVSSSNIFYKMVASSGTSLGMLKEVGREGGAIEGEPIGKWKEGSTDKKSL
uniref:Uncharacterized protein n=1 Tax=Cannabis sativa TaxID=3483 RepID=A0A803QG14_CANSA